MDKEIGTHLCFAGFLRNSSESTLFFSWPINIDDVLVAVVLLISDINY